MGKQPEASTETKLKQVQHIQSGVVELKQVQHNNTIWGGWCYHGNKPGTSIGLYNPVILSIKI